MTDSGEAADVNDSPPAAMCADAVIRCQTRIKNNKVLFSGIWKGEGRRDLRSRDQREVLRVAD